MDDNTLTLTTQRGRRAGAALRQWASCVLVLLLLWGLLATCAALAQRASWPLSAGTRWGLLLVGIVLCLVGSLGLLRQVGQLQRKARDDALRMVQLDEARTRAAEADQAKSAFLAAVSHELRTPLNAILGFSELIRDMAPDGEVHRYAELIHDSGAHLHCLVNTILDLTRIEAGGPQVERSRFDVGRVLATLVDIHRVTADRKGLGLVLRLDVEPGARLELDTDRTKFTQVIHNLLHNAVKFTSVGGIWVVASVVEGWLLVRVIDTGPGIPAQRLAAVLAPDVCAARPGCQEGSGLGLLLSRRLVEQLGGALQLYSQSSQGTEAEISLPGARVLPVQAP